MKKKALGLVLALTMVAGLVAGCGEKKSDEKTTTTTSTETETETETSGDVTGDAASVKVGVIYIGDENEGYTWAHMNGIEGMKKALGLSDDQVVVYTNIGEDATCYEKAVDLADQGCNIIFANSFGHEDYMLQAAAEYPNVQFCHATGYQAVSSGLPNMHNYFTNVYESRYVSGVVAGMKLNEMIANGEITEADAKVGYVGAYPYAEVISGFTSFYLGVISECPSATMEVQYTNSWADMATENEVATALIANGCVLISQHADTTGAPSACQAAKVPCVGYNVDMIPTAPDYALTSASIDWTAYYTYAVKCVINGEAIVGDWCKGYADGADKITALNDAAVAAGTADKVAAVEAAIMNGYLHVFDTTTFTVGGKSLEDAIADGTVDASYEAYVSDGYFHESELGSAPAFAIIIDGITVR